MTNIHLRVTNLGLSASFYTMLGFKVIRDSADSVHFSATGRDPAMLVLTGDSTMRPRQSRSPGLFHVAYLLPSRQELARMVKHIGECGLRISGFADHLVSEAAYLADPDGNGIEIYWDRPRSEWKTRNGTIEMATLGLDVEDLLAEAGQTSEWTGVPTATRIGHIHLQVSDLKKGEDFYHGVLGLDVTQRSYPGALFLSAGGYHHHIGLNVWNSRGATPSPKDAAGLVSFGLEIAEPEVLDGVITRIRKHSLNGEAMGASYFVRDHDGILVELNNPVAERLIIHS